MIPYRKWGRGAGKCRVSVSTIKDVAYSHAHVRRFSSLYEVRGSPKSGPGEVLTPKTPLNVWSIKALV